MSHVSRPNDVRPTRQDLLDDIIARYIDACEAGDAPDEQDLLDRYPEY